MINLLRPATILGSGTCVTLEPMRYPKFWERYKQAVKNNWTVDEIDWSKDVSDLAKLSLEEQHIIKRLVAFFATGDVLVGDNIIHGLGSRFNAPEIRQYYLRQGFEEALHVQFYHQLLLTYETTQEARSELFSAVICVPSIAKKAEFMLKHSTVTTANTEPEQALKNLLVFALAVEGLFFWGAFAYVYYLRSKGLLPGLADGTDWVFRDETQHIEAALDIVSILRTEHADLFTPELQRWVSTMLMEATQAEILFAQDLLGVSGIPGFALEAMIGYLKYTANLRAQQAGFLPVYPGAETKILPWMATQGARAKTNFFERTVSEYQAEAFGTFSNSADF